MLLAKDDINTPHTETPFTPFNSADPDTWGEFGKDWEWELTPRINIHSSNPRTHENDANLTDAVHLMIESAEIKLNDSRKVYGHRWLANGPTVFNESTWVDSAEGLDYWRFIYHASRSGARPLTNLDKKQGTSKNKMSHAPMVPVGFTPNAAGYLKTFAERVTGKPLTDDQVTAYFNDIAYWHPDGSAHIEISGHNTLSGAPETASFDANDFVYAPVYEPPTDDQEALDNEQPASETPSGFTEKGIQGIMQALILAVHPDHWENHSKTSAEITQDLFNRWLVAGCFTDTDAEEWHITLNAAETISGIDLTLTIPRDWVRFVSDKPVPRDFKDQVWRDFLCAYVLERMCGEGLLEAVASIIHSSRRFRNMVFSWLTTTNAPDGEFDYEIRFPDKQIVPFPVVREWLIFGEAE